VLLSKYQLFYLKKCYEKIIAFFVGINAFDGTFIVMYVDVPQDDKYIDKSIDKFNDIVYNSIKELIK